MSVPLSISSTRLIDRWPAGCALASGAPSTQSCPGDSPGHQILAHVRRNGIAVVEDAQSAGEFDVSHTSHPLDDSIGGAQQAAFGERESGNHG